MSGGGTDRGGLDYNIHITDQFSTPMNKFLRQLKNSKKEVKALKEEIASLNALSLLGSSGGTGRRGTRRPGADRKRLVRRPQSDPVSELTKKTDKTFRVLQRIKENTATSNIKLEAIVKSNNKIHTQIAEVRKDTAKMSKNYRSRAHGG